MKVPSGDSMLEEVTGNIIELCQHNDVPHTTGIIHSDGKNIDFEIYGVPENPKHQNARDAYAAKRAVTLAGLLLSYLKEHEFVRTYVTAGRNLAEVSGEPTTYLDVSEVRVL